MKMHYVGSKIPQMRQLWDYLWVGEGANNADKTREECKNHPPYVVPCLDLSTATVQNEDELYLHSIPYMQFPLLLAGRPFTGERSSVPGIKYEPEDRDPLLRRWRKIWRYSRLIPKLPPFTALGMHFRRGRMRGRYTQNGSSVICRWRRKAPSPILRSVTALCLLLLSPRMS